MQTGWRIIAPDGPVRQPASLLDFAAMKVIGWLVFLGFVVFMLACARWRPSSTPRRRCRARHRTSRLLSATILGSLTIYIVFKAARVPESRTARWVHSIIGPNGRYLFGLLVLLWIGYMLVLSNLPPRPTARRRRSSAVWRSSASWPAPSSSWASSGRSSPSSPAAELAAPLRRRVRRASAMMAR